MSAYFIFDQLKFFYQRLTSGWNEFRNAPYVSQLLSVPTGAIFGGRNNEMTKAMIIQTFT